MSPKRLSSAFARSHWKLRIDVVSKSLLEVITASRLSAACSCVLDQLPFSVIARLSSAAGMMTLLFGCHLADKKDRARCSSTPQTGVDESQSHRCEVHSGDIRSD